MMEDFQTNTIDIYGFDQTDETTGEKIRASEPLYTRIPACIQPGGTDIWVLSVADINASLAVVIYLEDMDVKIKNGYRLVDDDGMEYIVRGTPEVWKARGTLSHQKIAAEWQVEY